MLLNKTSILTVSAVAAAGFFMLCACEKKRPAEKPGVPVITAPAVETIRSEYTPSISNVQAFDTVDLVARVEGFLVKVNFKEGDMVEKDAVLFQIEPDIYEANVKAAEADLLKAQAGQANADTEYERQEKLLKTNATSQRMFDTAKSEKMQADAVVLAAEADLAKAKLNLGYTKITAPFKGRMSFKNYSEGNLVNASSGTLATIKRAGPVKVDFRLNELDMLRLIEHRASAKKNGNDKGKIAVPVELYFQNGKKYAHNGTIDAFDNQIKQSTGTFNIRAVFENPDEELYPGMYVKVVVPTSEPKKVVSIPATAGLNDMQGQYVFVVGSDNIVGRRNIKANREGSVLYVYEGLSKGENVISEGVSKIRQGSKVLPQTAKQAPELTDGSAEAANFGAGTPSAKAKDAKNSAPENGKSVKASSSSTDASK